MTDPRPSSPRRDVRAYALAATLTLVMGGGYLLDRWISKPTPGLTDKAIHATQQRKTEIDLRFRQGVMMLHAKQYEHALTAFHRLLQLAPEMPEAHVNMGFTLLGLKRYKEALDFFDSASSLKSDQLNAYFGMAEAFEGLGDYRGALEAMEAYLHRAKADDPFRPKAEAAVWEWREQLRKQAAANKAKSE